jgi:hypothetical protein
MKTKHSVSPTCRQPRDLFSQLVRRIVIHERRGALRELAEALGLSYGAMYSRVNSRAEFNPSEINLLLRELPDPRLVDCLLAGSGFAVIRKPESFTPRSGADIMDLALSCAVETLTAVRATVEATKGSCLDRERAIEIEGSVCRAQEKLSVLQVALAEAGRTDLLAEIVAHQDGHTDKPAPCRPNGRAEQPGANQPGQTVTRPLFEDVTGRLLTGVLGPVR